MAEVPSPTVLRIAAAIIEDAEGRLLFVRKRGTSAFMQPGGKLEPGEASDATLVRELHEELGLEIATSSLRFVGRFAAPAANEPGLTVDCDVYDVPLAGEPVVAAEIEELIWVDPTALPPRTTAPGALAPLSRDILVPLVLARR
ncbi:MAG: NUDIX domain-containing protein [Microbacteriaceae bacterium]